jgi:hypothetical protein
MVLRASVVERPAMIPAALTNCFVSVLHRVRFPAFAGPAATVTQPFVVRPQNSARE